MRFEPQVRPAGAAGPLPALHGPWRPPAIAFGISVLVHLAVLSVLGGAPHDIVPAPVLMVTFSPDGPDLAELPAPAMTPESTPPQQAAAPLVAKDGPPVKSTPEERPPAPPPPRQASAPPAPDDPVPRARTRPGIAPDIARELSGRRLRVSIWIDAAGHVSKVDLGGNELSEAAIAQLTDSLGKVRFAPAHREGSPVDSVLRTRMCFDDDGALDGRDPECSALAAQR
jgi:hypothetical protein